MVVKSTYIAFAEWLVMISDENLKAIQEHPVTNFSSEEIQRIRGGTKILDQASTYGVVPSIRNKFLHELATHPSTQHANEIFAKLGAIFGREKSEIWAGVFAAASNGFLLLGPEGKQEIDKDIETPSETLQEEPNSALEIEDKGPTCRKRFYQVYKKKLMPIADLIIA
jgi:hypothetical protein